MLLFAVPSSLSHQAFSLSYGAVQRRKPCICPRPSAAVLASSSSSFFARSVTHESHVFKPHRNSTHRTVTAILSGGGFLGVGPGELVVVAAVGWFLLGPEKLYTVSKDLGKLIGDLRRTANDARETFQDALESEITANLEPSKTDSSAVRSQLADGDSTSDTSEKQEGDKTDLRSDTDLTDDPTVSPSPRVTPKVIAATPAPQYDSESTLAENSAFLDQLKRVSDPRQSPPVSTLPDLSLDDSDDLDIEEGELELQRLKIQYLEARARLNERRKAASENKSNGVGHGAGNGANDESNGSLRDREPQSTDKNTSPAERANADS